MATFKLSMDEIIDRLRLPKDIELRGISLTADEVIFEVDGEGELQLVELPYQRETAMTMFGHEPKLVAPRR